MASEEPEPVTVLDLIDLTIQYERLINCAGEYVQALADDEDGPWHD